MKIFPALALLILGGTMMTMPALGGDSVMPPPVTDDMPPSMSDDQPALPAAPSPNTELPAPGTFTPRSELPPPAAAIAPPTACENCPPARPRYDSVEVIKKIRELDRSRTINTSEVVPSYAPPREAAPAYRVRSDVTLVNFVVHRYRVISVPELGSASEYGDYRPVRRSHHRAYRVACKSRYDRYGSCRPLIRVRG